MGRFIKLDGENIIEHISQFHPGINSGDYDALVSEDILINDDGDIKYKYSGGELVELSPAEIESQIVNAEKKEENKFTKLRNLVLTRRALTDVIDHPSVPANLKTRATNKRTVINQEIADLLGL